jgi:hypothetical protein
MNNDMTIATEIRNQLGGSALFMMGAKNVLGGERDLQFKISGSPKKVTNIRIELAADDTYTVEFFKIRGLNVSKLATAEGVYVDQLRPVIESHTALRLSL